MIGSAKITKKHLELLALVYLRQSTLIQVRENKESTARQYALAEEAARLGWESSKIAIIDADLGVSGRIDSGCLGFKELVSRVCLGGARPPREGEALLQGIVKCGSCGRTMSSVCSHNTMSYSCTHARANHTVDTRLETGMTFPRTRDALPSC
jgi:hypothetical protein